MSLATLCDRCKKVIEDSSGFHLYAYTAKQASEQYYRYGPHENSYDLCPSCYEQVRGFIKEGQ